MVACARNKLDIVKYLIETCGSDVNDTNIYNTNNENCLFYAVRENGRSHELAKYLLERGVETNVLNKNARSVLEFAVQLGDKGRIMQLLLSAQPAFDVNSVQNTLMYHALNFTCRLIHAQYLFYGIFKTLADFVDQ